MADPITIGALTISVATQKAIAWTAGSLLLSHALGSQRARPGDVEAARYGDVTLEAAPGRHIIGPDVKTGPVRVWEATSDSYPVRGTQILHYDYWQIGILGNAPLGPITDWWIDGVKENMVLGDRTDRAGGGLPLHISGRYTLASAEDKRTPYLRIWPFLSGDGADNPVLRYLRGADTRILSGGHNGRTARLKARLSARTPGPGEGSAPRRVRRIDIEDGGSGYTVAPIITFSSGGAAATATITDGAVTAVTITNSGSYYGGAPSVFVYQAGFPGDWTAADRFNGLAYVVMAAVNPAGYTVPGQHGREKIWNEWPSLEVVSGGKMITWPGRTTPTATGNWARVAHHAITEIYNSPEEQDRATFNAADPLSEETLPINRPSDGSYDWLTNPSKRYEVNTVIQDDEPFEDVLAMLEFCGQGYLPVFGNRRYYLPGTLRPVTLTIRQQDIMEPGAALTTATDLADYGNSVEMKLGQSRYHEYTELALDPVVNDAAVVADGKRWPLNLGIARGVTDPVTGVRLQVQTLRRIESSGTWKCRLARADLRYVTALPYAVCAVFDEEHGLDGTQRYVLKNRRVLHDLTCEVVLEEERAGMWADSNALPPIRPRPFVPAADLDIPPVVSGLAAIPRVVLNDAGAAIVELSVTWDLSPYSVQIAIDGPDGYTDHAIGETRAVFVLPYTGAYTVVAWNRNSQGFDGPTVQASIEPVAVTPPALGPNVLDVRNASVVTGDMPAYRLDIRCARIASWQTEIAVDNLNTGQSAGVQTFEPGADQIQWLLDVESATYRVSALRKLGTSRGEAAFTFARPYIRARVPRPVVSLDYDGTSVLVGWQEGLATWARVRIVQVSLPSQSSTVAAAAVPGAPALLRVPAPDPGLWEYRVTFFGGASPDESFVIPARTRATLRIPEPPPFTAFPVVSGTVVVSGRRVSIPLAIPSSVDTARAETRWSRVNVDQSFTVSQSAASKTAGTDWPALDASTRQVHAVSGTVSNTLQIDLPRVGNYRIYALYEHSDGRQGPPALLADSLLNIESGAARDESYKPFAAGTKTNLGVLNDGVHGSILVVQPPGTTLSADTLKGTQGWLGKLTSPAKGIYESVDLDLGTAGATWVRVIANVITPPMTWSITLPRAQRRLFNRQRLQWIAAANGLPIPDPIPQDWMTSRLPNVYVNSMDFQTLSTVRIIMYLVQRAPGMTGVINRFTRRDGETVLNQQDPFVDSILSAGCEWKVKAGSTEILVNPYSPVALTPARNEPYIWRPAVSVQSALRTLLNGIRDGTITDDLVFSISRPPAAPPNAAVTLKVKHGTAANPSAETTVAANTWTRIANIRYLRARLEVDHTFTGAAISQIQLQTRR